MARTSKTPAELEEAARHVGYEMRMLLFSSQHLEGWYASPITVDEDDANMALESFLLHFRNLRTFLCPSTQKLTSPDDVIASDFTTGDGSEAGDATSFVLEKQRIDKMLAHVSYTRGTYIASSRYC